MNQPISTIDASYVVKLQQQNAELQRQLRESQVALFSAGLVSGEYIRDLALHVSGDEQDLAIHALMDMLQLRIVLLELLGAVVRANANAEPEPIRLAREKATQLLTTQHVARDTYAALLECVNVMWFTLDALRGRGTEFDAEQKMLQHALESLRAVNLLPTPKPEQANDD